LVDLVRFAPHDLFHAHMERRTGVEVVMWMARLGGTRLLDANLQFRNIANRLGSSA